MEIRLHPYLFFAARIDPLKRQDRVIKTLYYLHKKGIKMHLYFCGSDYSKVWREKLDRIAKGYKVDGYIHYLGSVSQDTLKVLAFNAIANVLMIDGSSRNNVFYEIMSVGAIVVGLDDGGINDYITNEESGFLVKDERDAAEKIEYLLNTPEKREQIHKAARKEAKEKWGKIPITYAGGISSEDDLERFRSLGGGQLDFTIGSALDLFGGTVSYRKIVNKYN